MNNNLLIESIRDNPISLDERSAILIDDLFGLVLLEVKPDKSVYFTIYNQLNLGSANRFRSHHKSDGIFFYHIPNKKLRTYIMLNEEKTKSIDTKQNKLRMAL